MNVLLTSVGRRVALLRAFVRELGRLHPGSRVFGADASWRSAAFHSAHEGVLVPRCDSPEYIPFLLRLVSERGIRVLVPLIDTELLVLAKNRDAFAEVGCQVVVSDERVVSIARDKRQSAEQFGALGFRVPRVLGHEALADSERLEYPLFVKPASGSSSIGAVPVRSPEELRFWLARVKEPVVQSFERGVEYTIDVFADSDHRTRCAVPRVRWETRAGEISKGKTVKNPRLIDAAKRLVDRLGGCRGCVTLQCFVDDADRDPVFFEANLRFGGGFPLSDAAGANYVRWTLEMCEGKAIPDFDAWEDALVMLRYDDAIFRREECLAR